MSWKMELSMKPQKDWEIIAQQIIPRIEQGERVEVVLRLINQAFHHTPNEIEALSYTTESGVVEIACESYLHWSAVPRLPFPNSEPLHDILLTRIERLPLADKMRLFDDLLAHADLVNIFQHSPIEPGE